MDTSANSSTKSEKLTISPDTSHVDDDEELSISSDNSHVDGGDEELSISPDTSHVDDDEDFLPTESEKDINISSISSGGSSGSSGSDFQPVKKKKKPASKKNYKPRNDDVCQVCQDGGLLICCEKCPSAYHLSCLDPPLKKIPEKDVEWVCEWCALDPIPGKIEKILSWRWATDDSQAVVKKSGKKAHELLVKFAGMSYWKCAWISEKQLYYVSPHRYHTFKRKYGDEEPPNVDEEGYEAEPYYRKAEKQVGTKKEKEKFQKEMTEKYYKHGVKPDWFVINKVIGWREKEGGDEYLVKWRELGYEQTTWEDENNDIPGLQAAIAQYHELLDCDRISKEKSKSNKSKNKSMTPKGKGTFYGSTKSTSNMNIKLNKQPDYLDSTGMQLHNYQLEGLNWLRYSWANKIDTILADEMGLGKTIQAITFLYSLYKEGHSSGPFLVSAPLSTIINWEREFELWAPELNVVTYTGSKETRAIIREHEFSYDENAVRKSLSAPVIRHTDRIKFNVLLTSYENISVDKTTLGSIPWVVVVTDEAHRLKNSQSLFFTVLSDYQIDYKLLLTGTPLQNTLEELFCLLSFLVPSKFSDMAAFLEEFEDITKEEQVNKLHELLGTHMLRRMKADVLKDIPAKTELIVRVEMTPLQKKLCKDILKRDFKSLNSKGYKQASLQWIVVEWRKVCNHPYLFSGVAVHAPKNQDGSYELKALTRVCGKLILLSKMLKKLKEQGHRVLIFSTMTTLLDIVEDFIQGEGYKYERIDGSIMGSERQASIDRFNAPGAKQFVFLLSTKAGGLGINLATADTVIIYDSDWNPHNDIQAFSRCHRIGQKNKVMIYRFVCHSSYEERLIQIAKKKMMLTHLIVRNTIKPIESKAYLQEIVKFGAENLFKANEKEKITYTDAMIEDLLDRSKEVMEEEENVTANEFFQSFKVATYQATEQPEGEDNEENEEEDGEEEKPERRESVSGNGNPAIWDIMRKHFEAQEEDQPEVSQENMAVPEVEQKHEPLNGETEVKESDDAGSSESWQLMRKQFKKQELESELNQEIEQQSHEKETHGNTQQGSSSSIYKEMHWNARSSGPRRKKAKLTVDPLPASYSNSSMNSTPEKNRQPLDSDSSYATPGTTDSSSDDEDWHIPAMDGEKKRKKPAQKVLVENQNVSNIPDVI